MPIDPEELVLAARDHLTELPESVVFSRDALYGLIKPAISRWQTETAADPRRRHHFIVESAPIVITAGIADLADAIELHGFRLEFVAEGDIEMAYAGTPNRTVKFVNSLDRLKMKGRQDRFYILAYLNGTELRFKDAGATAIDTINGSFTLRSPVIPVLLEDLNRPVMYEIAAVVAELAKKQYREQNRGLDLPLK